MYTRHHARPLASASHGAQGATTIDMSAAYRRALSRLRHATPVLSYAARVGFCVGFVSLLPVLTDWSPAAAQLFQVRVSAPPKILAATS